MILHGFCWRSSKNTIFWPKTLIFVQKSKRYTKKYQNYQRFKLPALVHASLWFSMVFEPTAKCWTRAKEPFPIYLYNPRNLCNGSNICQRVQMFQIFKILTRCFQNLIPFKIMIMIIIIYIYIYIYYICIYIYIYI